MHELRVGKNSLLRVGSGILRDIPTLEQAIRGPNALLVCGRGLPDSLSHKVQDTLSHLPVKCDTLTLPDDETGKTLDNLATIFDRLLQLHHGRDTTLLALGGGVVGDMTGFAAACYQRGVDWINIPTTLLAQSDACIGGKTAVNHPLGKNMIGAFYPPLLVLADPETLKSLPERQFRSGLAEIIKHALIADATFFDWLEKQLQALLERRPEALEEAIHRSCAIKARIVSKDEREQGERALLNFGHSFGHAIETHGGYAGTLHGEAVAVGMILACRLSSRIAGLDTGVAARLEALLERAGLPTEPQGMGKEDFLTAMRRDKKVSNHRINLVLLRRIGRAELTEIADEKTLTDFLADQTGT